MPHYGNHGPEGKPKAKRTQPKTHPPFERKTFVNIRLDKDRRDEFTGYLEVGSMTDDLDTILQSGHKLSLSWSDDYECFQAMLFATDVDAPNFPYVLVARGSTAARTLTLLCWGHVHWCEGEWAQFALTQVELFV
jgi:hypothetical protein